MESVNNKEKLRVFFLPFFASGHMIPMADLAALFVVLRHVDVEPTLCLTPLNADFLRPSLHPDVRLLLYPFPSEQCGLSPGKENLSSVSADEEWKIYKAVDLCRPEHDRILREHAPDAVFADVPFSWTTDTARDIGIPRITWHAVGVFPQVVMNSLYNNHRCRDGTHDYYHVDGCGGNDDVVRIKDLPGAPIAIPMSELPEFVRSTDHMAEAWDRMKKAQLDCFGAVVNTCYEMERLYCDHYRRTDCRRGWFVGPVTLRRRMRSNNYADEKAMSADCLKWLDGKEEGSVVYVCFGSWCRFRDEQLTEMAVGLEQSGQPFLWVVRASNADTMERWIPRGWEERVKGRGLVVRGWAPQVAILRHSAVGAFLAHCGWNSIIESAAEGVPMLTWPLVFEQFINERLVVEVWKAGRRVFDGSRSTTEDKKELVPAGAIAKAITQFMEKGGGREAAREGARKVAVVAKAAVAEDGSSWKDLNDLIDQLMEAKKNKKKNVNC